MCASRQAGRQVGRQWVGKHVGAYVHTLLSCACMDFSLSMSSDMYTCVFWVSVHVRILCLGLDVDVDVCA